MDRETIRYIKKPTDEVKRLFCEDVLQNKDEIEKIKDSNSADENSEKKYESLYEIFNKYYNFGCTVSNPFPNPNL